MTNLAMAAEAALKKKPYAPEVVIVLESNPSFSGPQAGFMADFLESVPLSVSISPYLDETTSQADVALPSAAFLESWGDCTTPYASAKASYGIYSPLIKVEENALPAGDIVLTLAKMLGGDVAKALPFDNMEKALKARTAMMGDFKKLTDKSAWAQAKTAYGDFPFKTPSGKLEFISQSLAEVVMGAMPKGMRPVEYLRALGVNDPGMAFMPHFEGSVLTAPEGAQLLMSGIPSLRTTDGSRPITPT